MSQLAAIYSCKMYKSNKNKAKIIAAINNPINAELVQQLSEYLDDGVVDVKDTNSIDDKRIDVDDGATDEIKNDRNDNFFDDDTDVPEVAIEEDDTSDEDQSDEIVEAVNVDNSSVMASSTFYNNDRSINIEVIKGTLNGREDTSGENRVLVKDDELWIHYNDSVNLNSLMAPVIEFMNASGYNYLNFNRLARSENAIVFEIVDATSSIDHTLDKGDTADGK